MTSRILLIMAIVLFYCAYPADSADLYKVIVVNQEDADFLNSLDIQPVYCLSDGYLIFAENQFAKQIIQNGIELSFIKSDVDIHELAVDMRRDKDNVGKYPLLYEQDSFRLFNYDAKSGSNREMMPILDPPPFILGGRRDVTLNPSLSYGNLDIESFVEQINQDSLMSYLTRLEAFYRRLTGTDSCFAARDWIFEKFTSFGYDSTYIDYFPSFQQWEYDPVDGYNVVATKIGSLYPEKHIIVGAHYDALDGPGADDNGTGTSAMLEFARIFSTIETEYTIVFIAFDSEESWWVGASHYVDDALARGDDMVYMLNLDMIGTDIGATHEVVLYHGRVNSYAVLWSMLADSLFGGYSTYYPRYSYGGDEVPFQEAGVDVTFVFEYDLSEHYHSPSDSIVYLNIDYYLKNVKTSLALFHYVTEAPPLVDASLIDVGDGSSLELSWQEQETSNLNFYRVYYHTGSFIDLDSTDLETSQTGYVIDGLIEGQEYTVHVISVDNDDQSTILTVEKKLEPYSNPRPPTRLAIFPGYRAIELTWEGNNQLEKDFSHYTIVRDGVALLDKLTEFSFVDNDYSLDTNEHTYMVYAVDTDGNISDTVGVESLVARAASLTPGKILAVNRSSDNFIFIVNEATTGEFIRDGLSGYNYDYYSDSAYANKPLNEQLTIDDFLDYELIIVGGESGRNEDFGFYEENGGILNGLKDYLSIGGKLILFSRWGDMSIVSENYKTVQFIHSNPDYAYSSRFHIDFRVDYVHLFDGGGLYPDLIGTHNQVSEYPALVWDSLATVDHSYPWSQVSGIPCPSYFSLSPDITNLEVLYTYDSRTDNIETEGMPIAWKYLGEDYQYFFFGIPLSFFDRATASTVLQTAVSELLTAEVVGSTILIPEKINSDDYSETTTVLLGDLVAGKVAADIDISTASVNGSIIPTSTSILAEHPDFTGSVLQLDISTSDFLLSYGRSSDSSDFGYIVSWQFSGESDILTAYGGVTIVGQPYVSGDANGDGGVDVGDAVYIVNHVFKGGPAPEPLIAGDANCDGSVNVGDAVYLINHVFKGGPGPCE
ncbi:MAG: M28 family peptidase [candidate division Zixibacteria bacterium]